MATNLSRELQKYYTRKGNRIIFANGMTLNQLAWEMWERLGYSEIDPSVLSRVIKGERMFSGKQLNIFCNIIRCNSSQVRRLKKILNDTILEKFGLENIGEKYNLMQAVSLLENIARIVKDTEKRGVPILTKQTSESSLAVINKILNNLDEDKIRRKIIDIEARILIEYSNSLFGLESSSLFEKVFAWPIKRITDIGVELKKPEYINTSNIIKASVFYHTDKDQFTSDMVIKSIQDKKIDDFQIMTGIHAAIISEGKLKKVKNVNVIKKLVGKYASNWPDNYKIMMFDSLARAQYYLGDIKTADKYINMAWKEFEKLDSSENNFYITRYLGLIRTELMISNFYKNFRETDYLERSGKNAIKLSKSCGFIRAGKMMEGYLENILN